MSDATAFPVNPTLTAIAIAYQNTSDSLIADRVLPRIQTDMKFSWTRYEAAQAYTVPDTHVGRTSEPNVVGFSGEEVDDSVNDYGLDDIIAHRDLKAFDDAHKPETGGPLDPKEVSTAFLTNLVLLGREIRVANAVQDPSNYAANNIEALSGTDQWDDYANGSDPIDDIMNALDIPLLRPNTIALSQKGWTKLRRNPKAVQAIFGVVKDSGSITRQQLADHLEVESVLIGGSFVNTAKKGQAPNFVRTWGNHCALLHINKEAATAKQPTFGFTAQWGTRIAGEIAEKKMGLRGSVRVRSGESVKEVVCAPDAGFLLQNVISG